MLLADSFFGKLLFGELLSKLIFLCFFCSMLYNLRCDYIESKLKRERNKHDKKHGDFSDAVMSEHISVVIEGLYVCAWIERTRHYPYETYGFACELLHYNICEYHCKKAHTFHSLHLSNSINSISVTDQCRGSH